MHISIAASFGGYAARVVTKCLKDQSSFPFILQPGWLTVNELIDFETVCTVDKVLKGLAPIYMQSMFHSWFDSCNRP